MADKVQQHSTLPQLRPNDKFAATNYVNEVVRAISPVLLRDGQPGRGTFVLLPFRVTGSTFVEIGRWKYAGDQVIPQRSQAGEDSYVNVSPALSITELWNDAEERNGGGFDSSIYGNGVALSHLDGATGFSLQPIPSGRVVWAREVHVVDSGSVISEWRFVEPNGVDGVCPP